MVALYILGGLLLLIVLLLMSRAGVHLAYFPDRRFLRVKLGLFRRTIRLDEPRTVRASKRKKEKKPKQRRSLADSAALVKSALQAAGRLVKAIRMDKIQADVTVGHDDPADAAINFGRLQILWYSMASLLRHCQIPPSAVRFHLDFDAPKTSAQGEIKVSVRVGALLGMAVKIGLANGKVRTLSDKAIA